MVSPPSTKYVRLGAAQPASGSRRIARRFSSLGRVDVITLPSW